VTNDQIHELARVGAQARLGAIESERKAILQVFPTLGSRPAASRIGSPAPAGRTRRGMSPSQRKAVGKRMKAYWASRRAEKASGREAVSKTSQRQRPSRSKSGRRGMSAAARKAQGERMRAAAKKTERNAAAAARPPRRAAKGRKAARKK
jgi:hypothetical protein